MLRVTDNGCGISPAMNHWVFEPFFTTKEFTGAGLGIWLSKSIVDKHGGEIRVTSCTKAPDHGTTFELVLQRGNIAIIPLAQEADCDRTILSASEAYPLTAG